MQVQRLVTEPEVRPEWGYKVCLDNGSSLESRSYWGGGERVENKYQLNPTIRIGGLALVERAP